MSKPIKVGVVGCGYWGPNLIRNFRSLQDCTLKMMCDLSEERLAHLKALYPEVKGETDFNHMLNGAGARRRRHRDDVEIALPDGQSELAGRQTHVHRKADGGVAGGMRRSWSRSRRRKASC